MIQERARQGESAREEIARLRKELQEALSRGRQREEMDVEEGFIEEYGLGINFEIVGGYRRKNIDNPGKLVVEDKQKFLFNRKVGNTLYYHCSKKETLKCTMKAKLVDEDGAFTLVELGENHNHEDMEGAIVAEKIQREMKERYQENFRKTPGEVIQQVMNKYKLVNDGKPVWKTIVEYLPSDVVLSKNLRRHKAECIGNIPRGRNALDLQKVLEGMLSAGGDRVKYLDSNELFENDDNFKAGLEVFLGGGEVPERVLLMTTDPLFHLLAESKKISVDGTFRIAPSYWKQVFILQVCSKDKVVYFALMDILQKNILLMCLHVHYKCAFTIAPLITQLQLFSGEGGREVASSGLRPLA